MNYKSLEIKNSRDNIKSIGCGKSTAARIMVMYMYHRLDCTKNVYKSLNLVEGAKLALVVTHASKDTADRDFIRYFKDEVFEKSPYFRKLYNLRKNQIRLVAAGPRTNSIIGLNVFAVNNIAVLVSDF
jgi:dephospho-CoA kinase